MTPRRSAFGGAGAAVATTLPGAAPASYLEHLESAAHATAGAKRDGRGRILVEVEGVVVSQRSMANDFTIGTLEARTERGTKEQIRFKGTLAVHSGCRYRFTGRRSVHPQYGEQLDVTGYEQVFDGSQEGALQFLGSGLFPELGAQRAREFVDRYGDRAVELLTGPRDEAIAALATVRGLTPARAERIVATYHENAGRANVLMGLMRFGITPFKCSTLMKEYGLDAISVLEADPYRPAYEIDGFGFKTVDSIATRMGLDNADPRRLRAGALYALEMAAEDGHTWQSTADMESRARKDLGLSSQALEQGARDLAARQNAPIVAGDTSGGWYALAKLHADEQTIADAVLTAMGYGDADAPDDRAAALAREMGCTPQQAEAVARLAGARLSILTGGPGTGKTYTLKAVLRHWESHYEPVFLAAPTGKAAVRMEEATGHPASTIHRLLAFHPAEGWRFNRDNPLPAGHVVIDESSMVDVPLMRALVDAIDWDQTTLTLVGDVDQLPSVGPGAVLRDLIASGRVPVSRLTTIQRQAEGSTVTLNAHRIIHGEATFSDNGARADWFDLDFPDVADKSLTGALAAEMADALVHIVVDQIPRSTQYHPIRDVQVLAPQKKGPLGVAELNRRLQAALNPESPGVPQVKIGGGGDSSARVLRAGDKAMQTRNNYKLGVFNGESGIVTDCGAGFAVVDFGGGRAVRYEGDANLHDLVPAYAITVHKSQGSEYPVVVLPVSTQHWQMLGRQLIYTAVTRAKAAVVAVSTGKAWRQVLRNAAQAERNTMLEMMIRRGASASAGCAA